MSEIIETANKIDPLLSNTTRLLILASLYIIGPMYEADLAKLLKISWGKLATHLNKLEKAGYIKKQKVIGEDRPRTLIKPTKQGITKLHQHLEALTQLHTKLKKTALNPKQLQNNKQNNYIHIQDQIYTTMPATPERELKKKLKKIINEGLKSMNITIDEWIKTVKESRKER